MQTKLDRILMLFLADTLELVNHVLTDNKEDHHYSAVTASRKIHAYNAVKRLLNNDYKITNVYFFLKAHGYNEESIKYFEIRMEEEMPFYFNHNIGDD